MSRVRDLLARPWPVASLIATGAALLFGWRLATPHVFVFDEIHYVPAARTLWSLDRLPNLEHPPLGKELIGLGIALFGDGPIGWRVPSLVAAVGTVLGLFASASLLFRAVRPAVVTALFAIGNMTLFAQARIAMLDGFMAALVVLALAAMLWAMRGAGAQVWRRWLLGSVLLGLAAGAKWVAVPYIVFAAAGFLLARGPTRWPGLRPLPALVLLASGSAAAYALTFLPLLFLRHDPLTIGGFPALQLEMWRAQRQVLPHHTYQSSWWSWPLLLRPIWYLYERADGAQRGILMIGNPAVMWGGLVAVAACAWGWWRERSAALGGVAALWLGGWGMWALVPKSLGFFYYYYLPSLWLPLALAAACHRWARGRLENWDEAALALTGGLFIYFYPIVSAGALRGPAAFGHWMWFSSWI